MFPKMIVTDLDRTLLTSSKTISERTRRVLLRAQGAGIKVVFATARPIRAVKNYLDTVPADAVIYHNGAITYLGNMKIGDGFGIRNADVRSVMLDLQARDENRRLSLEINDTLYANFDAAVFWPGTETNYTDFTDLPDLDADKLMIEIYSPSDFESVKAALPDYLYGQISEGTIGLVMNKKANKRNALEALCKQLGISASDTIGFGDDLNDIEMLEWCKTGVAVENAFPEVKAAADEITSSNDADGVAEYLEKLGI